MMFDRSEMSKSNVRIKSAITFLAGLGIFFCIYGSLSCRWFVSTQDEATLEEWDFLPSDKVVPTIGLFRYQVAGGSDTTQGEPFAPSSENIQCQQYTPLFLGSDYSWIYTTQICVVLGPIMTIVAWIFAILGVNKNPTAFFMLLATGLQAASVVASMGWCDEFWNCPWLAGSLANIAAASLFFLSWLLAMFGLKTEEQCSEKDGDSTNSNFYSTTAKGGVSQVEESVLSYGFSNGHEEEESDDENEEYDEEEVKERIIYIKSDKRTAEELLGTDDPIIHRAVYQNARVNRDIKSRLEHNHEENNDDDDDDISVSSGSGPSDEDDVENP